MLYIIFYIILALLLIFYILIKIYSFNQDIKLSRYKPYYNYEILDYADQIKKHTGLSKFYLRRIIKGGIPLSIDYLIAISVVMKCDLNYLICSYCNLDDLDVNDV